MFAGADDFIRSCWSSQPHTLADTQAYLGQLAQALWQRRLQKVLINQVTMLPFSAEEQTWISNEWLPRTVRDTGYRCGAVVLATDLYSRLATASITTNPHNLALRYRSFDNETEAEAWLRQQ